MSISEIENIILRRTILVTVGLPMIVFGTLAILISSVIDEMPEVLEAFMNVWEGKK